MSGAAECEGMLAGRSALMAVCLVGCVCTRCKWVVVINKFPMGPLRPEGCLLTL